MFQSRLVLGALGASVALCACGRLIDIPAPKASASSLALSNDDALIYAVDTDNQIVAVVDAKSEAKIAEVKAGRGAEKIVVAVDDTLYITNRLDGTVTTVARGDWANPVNFVVGVEPTSLALSSDGKRLYVVNAVARDSADEGTLSAFDPASQQLLWEIPVGNEPRGVALTDDSHAQVTLSKAGDVATVDLDQHKVVRNATELYSQMNASGLSRNSEFGIVATSHARAMGAITTSPDGKYTYALGMVARESQVNAWGGPCGGEAVAAPGFYSFRPDGSPIVDDVSNCSHPNDEVPPTVTRTNDFGGPVIQGPTAVAVNGAGDWLFVANQQSDNVTLMRAFGSEAPLGLPTTVRAIIHTGSGPNGVALTRDNKKAYVFNAFDHSISVLENASDTIRKTRDIVVAQDVLPDDVVAGRKAFFNAGDSRISGTQFGVACATCHVEGREDGHVWTFAEGPRQTISLAGRLKGTAPFHWDGVFATLDDLMIHTAKERMGGSGPDTSMTTQIAAYLDTLPLPPNPNAKDHPTDAQIRGAQAFQKAECNTCHAGALLTNNGFAHVGTEGASSSQSVNLITGQRVESFPNGGVNVPSLIGLARSAPYLHDGSAATLRDRIENNKQLDLHGKTSLLSDAEVDDLIAYLKSL